MNSATVINAKISDSTEKRKLADHGYQPKELAEAFFVINPTAEVHKCKGCNATKKQKLQNG
jgi:hypothetical protein